MHTKPGNGDHRAKLAPLSQVARVALAVRIWVTYAAVLATLRRHPLPEAVSLLAAATGPARHPVSLLSRAVSRALRVGPWQPRCLTRSLVLFRLLREQGHGAQLVIGLPADAHDPDAHAWVELDGRDVGPVPGRHGHEELVRYPRDQSHDRAPA